MKTIVSVMKLKSSILILILWVHATLCYGQWTSPVLLEPNEAGASLFPRVAMDDNGNGMAIWIKLESPALRYNLWASRYTAGQGWSTPEIIEDKLNDAEYATLAIRPNGNVVVVWAQVDTLINSYLWTREYVPGTGWGSIRKLPDDNSIYDISHIAISFSANGTGVLAWEGYSVTSGQGIYASLSLAGGWSSPQLISSGLVESKKPTVGMDDQGNAIVAWTVTTTNGSGGIWSSQLDSASVSNTITWSSPVVRSVDRKSLNPKIAMNASGDAIIAWYTSEAEDPAAPFAIKACRYTPAGGWTMETTVYAELLSMPQLPEVAMDNTGNAIAVWRTFYDATFNTYASRFTPDQGWSEAEDIDMSSLSALNQKIAMDDAGNAVAVWSQPQTESGTEFVWSRHYIVGSGWQEPELIDTGVDQNADLLNIAANGVGDVIVTWAQYETVTEADVWASTTTTSDASTSDGSNGGNPDSQVPSTDVGGDGGSSDGSSGGSNGDSGGGALSFFALVLMALRRYLPNWQWPRRIKEMKCLPTD